MAVKITFTDPIEDKGNIAKGFSAIFEALKIISNNKGFIRYFVIPFILNLLILGGIVYFAYDSLYPWLDSLIPNPETVGNCFLSCMLTGIKFILAPIILLIFITIALFLYTFIGCIVVAPFNDMISQKTEIVLTGENGETEMSVLEFLGDMARIGMNILKLLGLMIIIYLSLSVLNIIPVIGSIAFVILSFLSTMFFVGFQFFDFPLERRQLIFGDKLKVAWKFKSLVIGLGIGFSATALIPIIGFLGLNLGAVGATALFVNHIKSALIIEKTK